MTEEKKPKGLVRSLLDPSPSLMWELVRKEEDGSETVHPYRCRLLRKTQMDDALEAAQEYASKKEKNGYSDIYKEAQAVEILRQAIVHVDMGTREDGTKFHLPMFHSSKALRDSLSTEEMAQMLTSYELTRSHFGFSSFDPESVESAVEALAGEFSGPFFLSRVASDEWPHLIYSLARLALTWRPETHPTPSDTPSSSESDPSSSNGGTTSSGELPELRSKELDLSLKNQTKILTREEAREVVKNQKKKS